MAVYRGEDTPYAQAQKNASASAATLITSDAQINKSIEDYITLAVELQTVVRDISKIVDAYYIEDKCKVRLIEDIIGKGDE